MSVLRVTWLLGFFFFSFSHLAAQETDCDRLAGSPDDRSLGHPGVELKDLDAPRAISACEVALSKNPTVPKIKYALGRALFKAGRSAEAAKMFLEGARSGHVPSAYAYGAMLASGSGVSANEPESVVWYQRAAEAGYPKAMRELGVALENGRGVVANARVANAWYKKAADAGDVKAMRFLGMNLQRGIGIEADPAMAKSWFAKANDSDGLSHRWNTGSSLTADNFANSPFSRWGLGFDDAQKLLSEGYTADHIINAANDCYMQNEPIELGCLKPAAKLRRFDPQASKTVKALLEYNLSMRKDKKLIALMLKKNGRRASKADVEKLYDSFHQERERLERILAAGVFTAD